MIEWLIIYARVPQGYTFHFYLDFLSIFSTKLGPEFEHAANNTDKNVGIQVPFVRFINDQGGVLCQQ
jgi:hypothetical protein